MMNKWDKRYFNIAKEVSTWSKDPRVQVGAVIIGDKDQILSQGYNGFPRNIDDNQKRYSDRDTKRKYIVHAEMNVFYRN